MQEPRSTSTLELVVNEQQLQNMSQVDLSRTGDSSNNEQQRHNQSGNDLFSFQKLKEWPARFRESFSAKLDEAKAKSETKTELVFEVFQAFSGIVIWVLCFVCTIIVPVILFFIGLANLDNCPDRPSLPYLIFATGFAMTASNLFNLALALDLPILTNHQILTSETKNIIVSIINIIFNCVVAFLYILSGYMVFTMAARKRQSSTESDPGSTPSNELTTDDDGSQVSVDCGGLLYNFTFWFVTLTLGLFAFLGLLAAILFAYNKYRLAIIRGSTPRSEN